MWNGIPIILPLPKTVHGEGKQVYARCKREKGSRGIERGRGKRKEREEKVGVENGRRKNGVGIVKKEGWEMERERYD